MKKIIAISLIVLASIFILFQYSVFSKESKEEIKNVQIDRASFQVEVAKSDFQRHLGLSGRKELCPSCGMIFEWTQAGIYPFTMHGMNFPLDMIWINNGKIAAISKNVPITQQIVNPNVEVNEVMELNAGTADKYGFKEGDGVE